MSKLFSNLLLKSSSSGCTVSLANRIIVAPMCQYSAINGEATDWHLMHWGNLLNSGAGLFIIEATAVSPEGRISPACLGIWDRETQDALANKLSRAKALAPDVPVFIQLAHAGRKGSSAVPWDGGQLLSIDNGGWTTAAPSALPQLQGERFPQELSAFELIKVKNDFMRAAGRAQSIGVDGVELHFAHGYLLHQFLSPVSNHRSDRYGGSLANRMRFPLEVFEAVRGSFSGVLGVRISATDWLEEQDEGWTLQQSVELAAELRDRGCDYIHVSSGGISPKQQIKVESSYQVAFAKNIKEQTGLVTVAVGLITDPHQAEAILQAEDADAVALARAFLYNPRWGWEAATALNGKVSARQQYWRCLPREAKNIFGNVSIGQR